MKLRFNYNKIAGLCRIHNIVGSSKDNVKKYVRIKADYEAVKQSAGKCPEGE